MIAVLQRVTQARVSVAGENVGEIGLGLLVLVAVEKGDSRARAERLAGRLLGYRVFPDAEGRMNLSVTEVGGGVLLVPPFTLAAGTRPSFTPAAAPDTGRRLFDCLVESIRARHPRVATGRFGAYMSISLVNDGPMTFLLEARS